MLSHSYCTYISHKKNWVITIIPQPEVKGILRGDSLMVSRGFVATKWIAQGSMGRAVLDMAWLNGEVEKRWFYRKFVVNKFQIKIVHTPKFQT